MTGTVGANKEAVKLIGNYHKDMSVQAYFEYDAKKSSGWTISHMRFSPKVGIRAPFRVEECQGDYVACHNEGYVQANKFDVVKFCKRRGNFFLNTSVAAIVDPEERINALEQLISPKILRQLAMKNVNVSFLVLECHFDPYNTNSGCRSFTSWTQSAFLESTVLQVEST